MKQVLEAMLGSGGSRLSKPSMNVLERKIFFLVVVAKRFPEKHNVL